MNDSSIEMILDEDAKKMENGVDTFLESIKSMLFISISSSDFVGIDYEVRLATVDLTGTTDAIEKRESSGDYEITIKVKSKRFPDLPRLWE